MIRKGTSYCDSIKYYDVWTGKTESEQIMFTNIPPQISGVRRWPNPHRRRRRWHGLDSSAVRYHDPAKKLDANFYMWSVSHISNSLSCPLAREFPFLPSAWRRLVSARRLPPYPHQHRLPRWSSQDYLCKERWCQIGFHLIISQYHSHHKEEATGKIKSLVHQSKSNDSEMQPLLKSLTK